VDVTIEHPLAPSRWPLNLTRVQRTLPDAEMHKRTQAEERCARHQWEYIGAAFNPWGCTGPAASKLLRDVLRLATNSYSGTAKQRKFQELTENLAITLARAVARQLRLAERATDRMILNS
jgi:hypothetical protein